MLNEVNIKHDFVIQLYTLQDSDDGNDDEICVEDDADSVYDSGSEDWETDWSIESNFEPAVEFTKKKRAPAAKNKDEMNESDEEDIDVIRLICEGMANESSNESSEESDGEAQMLFPGSDHTTDETVLKLFTLYLENKWSKKSLEGTRRTLAELIKKPNNMPSSLYRLFKYIFDLGCPVQEVEYFCCRSCKKLKGQKNEECGDCQTSEAITFYYFPLEEQIRFLFEKRNLASLIDEYRDQPRHNDGCIRDIGDGFGFRMIRNSSTGKYDLELIWNTDGIALSKSSNETLYPIQNTPCNIAPSLRSSFIIVNAIWCDSEKPLMNEFLKPFVDDLAAIYAKGGVTWTCPVTNVQKTSQVIAPICIGDAPVRADVQNLQHHSGTYSCNICEQGAVPVAIKKRGKNGKVTVVHRRYLVYQKRKALLRTASKMLRQGNAAKNSKRGAKNVKTFKGMKGVPVVRRIPHFDISKSLPPEYMHSLCLGTVKRFLLLMLLIKGDWYCGHRAKEIDQLLLNIRVPNFVRRLPRSIKFVKKWKASEFRTWLLFFSLPVLARFLPDKYVQHWALLVWASFLLLQDKISPSDLDTADELYRMFNEQLSGLYRKQDYTYNNHQLLHYKLMVRFWGNLQLISAFSFEGNNGVLARMIHGTKHKGKELAINIRIAYGVQVLRNKVKGFIKSSVPTVDVDNPLRWNFDENQKFAFGSLNIGNYHLFGKVKTKNEEYTSELSERKRNGHMIKTSNSNISF